MNDLNYLDIAANLYAELERSCTQPGATIKITVARPGESKEYELYDHAALVQGLMDAIGYFITEQ